MDNDKTIKSSIISVIYNNDTITFDENMTNFKTPLLSVNKEMYDELTKYSVEKEEDNIFVQVVHFKYVNSPLNDFAFYSSIVLSLYVLIISIIYHVFNWKIYRHEITTLQRVLNALIDLRVVYSFLLLYYIHLLSKKISIENMNDRLVIMYIYTVVITINGVYMTLLWVTILLIAYGWQITRSLLSRYELRKFVICFIGIYIITCLDPVIDYCFGVKIFHVK